MEEIKKILENMRLEIVNSIQEDREKSKKVKTNDIGDEADQVIEERAQEMYRIFSNRDTQKLHLIDEALERIKDGDYGFCDECGDEIAQKRLKAVPFTRLCFECQSNEEISSSSRIDTGGDTDFMVEAVDDPKD